MSRLDLKTLRLFAAICEAGTLNGAARRAAIAPSAVSKRLAELERALGCALLTREPRGMRPTPAGETLLHHTHRMLASAEQMALELAEHAHGAQRQQIRRARAGADERHPPAHACAPRRPARTRFASPRASTGSTCRSCGRAPMA